MEIWLIVTIFGHNSSCFFIDFTTSPVMTREEYERLLQSPYWKGYSYSLIKERNFTCQDCGRSFPNERNKLQVHHLVYRDASPWSYDPDELVVLCEECHKKRHGIISETTPVEEPKAPETDNYTRSYSSDYNTYERDVRPTVRRYPTYYSKKRKKRMGVLAFVCLLTVFLIFANPGGKKTEDNRMSSAPAKTEVKNNLEKARKEVQAVDNKPATISEKTSASKTTAPGIAGTNEPAEEIVVDAHIDEVSSADQTIVVESLDLPPTIDIFENNPEEVARTVEQVDESRELTTLELLERKNHENAVKMAQRAGVSTEGTTIELLDRVNHANAIKQAQRAGVSTEGTTTEILERVTHANAVKQAQRAGMSTEGTTMEILERVNHANVVKQAQRAGVSTDGTTLEILDRINKKNLENSGN